MHSLNNVCTTCRIDTSFTILHYMPQNQIVNKKQVLYKKQNDLHECQLFYFKFTISFAVSSPDVKKPQSLL